MKENCKSSEAAEGEEVSEIKKFLNLIDFAFLDNWNEQKKRPKSKKKVVKVGPEETIQMDSDIDIWEQEKLFKQADRLWSLLHHVKRQLVTSHSLQFEARIERSRLKVSCLRFKEQLYEERAHDPDLELDRVWLGKRINNEEPTLFDSEAEEERKLMMQGSSSPQLRPLDKRERRVSSSGTRSKQKRAEDSAKTPKHKATDGLRRSNRHRVPS